MVENNDIKEGNPVAIVNENSAYYGRKGTVKDSPDEDEYSTDTYRVKLETENDEEETADFLKKELEIRKN